MRRAVNIVLWGSTTLALATLAFCIGLVYWEDGQRQQKYGLN